MRLIRQRAEWDCSVAALLMIAPELTYDAVLDVVAKIDPKWRGRNGLYNREILAVAAHFGIWLTPTRRREQLDAGRGVLRIYWHQRDRRAKASPGGHAVALMDGRILDPGTGTALAWRRYASQHHARLGTLLERV